MYPGSAGQGYCGDAISEHPKFFTLSDTNLFIVGKDKSEFGAPFWDTIVLTTADEDQKLVFEEQVRQKLEQKELPLGVPIHVIADPPGPKLGIKSVNSL